MLLQLILTRKNLKTIESLGPPDSGAHCQSSPEQGRQTCAISNFPVGPLWSPETRLRRPLTIWQPRRPFPSCNRVETLWMRQSRPVQSNALSNRNQLGSVVIVFAFTPPTEAMITSHSTDLDALPARPRHNGTPIRALPRSSSKARMQSLFPAQSMPGRRLTGIMVRYLSPTCYSQQLTMPKTGIRLHLGSARISRATSIC